MPSNKSNHFSSPAVSTLSLINSLVIDKQTIKQLQLEPTLKFFKHQTSSALNKYQSKINIIIIVECWMVRSRPSKAYFCLSVSEYDWLLECAAFLLDAPEQGSEERLRGFVLIIRASNTDFSEKLLHRI